MSFSMISRRMGFTEFVQIQLILDVKQGNDPLGSFFSAFPKILHEFCVHLFFVDVS